MTNEENKSQQRLRYTGEQDPQTYKIIGAAQEVHRILGSGFLEGVYQEALAFELEERLIPFQREIQIPIRYKREMLTCTYRADFSCLDEIIVELKAWITVGKLEQSQFVNYLKGTGYKRGLLLNFGAPSLQSHRLFLSENIKSIF